MNTKFIARYQREILFHTAGWIIFIIYEVSFVTLIRGFSLELSVWKTVILPYFINICLFYFHAFICRRIFDRANKLKIPRLIILVVTELIIYLFIMGAKDLQHPFSYKGNIYAFLYPSQIKFIQQLWRGIYFLIFSTAFCLIRISFKNEKLLKEAEKASLIRLQEKRELEIKLISSENAFLQAQINPHLLFNTLNFIHNEIYQISSTASKAILILSDMMRYSITELKLDGKVSLEKEIEQIENLINLNQIRFHKKLFIDFSFPVNHEQYRIVPLLLVPFVENIFKHADLNNKDNPVILNIWTEQNTLYFKSVNNKKKSKSLYSLGIGIQNVKTRLNTYYDNNYTLVIDDLPDIYSVTLRLNL